MSYPKPAGFTTVELLVTISLIGIMSTIVYSAFNTSIVQYFGLQKESLHFTSLAGQSQRLANVLRGTTDIIAASQDELTIYAYFAPTDAYVSQVRYYKNAAQTVLYADVTQMTSNPPIGTPIPASLKTYTILDNFFQSPSVRLFTYFNATGGELTPPIADLNTVNAVKTILAVPTSKTATGQSIELQVSLRNRKTNL